MALHTYQKSMSVPNKEHMNSRVIAIIPARGGSKGVPGKNLRRVGGRSLVARAVDACRAARRIAEVYVGTDDAEIAASAEVARYSRLWRPMTSCGAAAEASAS
jgi:CMP-N-acetylneuraminic acid synthetase